jgi:hypothetical protein
MTIRKVFKRHKYLTIFVVSLLLLTTACVKESQANDNKPENREKVGKDSKDDESRQGRLKKEDERINILVKNTPAVAQMVAKYQAVQFWENDVKDIGHVFAVNVQEAIVRGNKRPILLINQIDDLAKEGDKYYINFESLTYTHDIYFTLECNAEQVNKLTTQSSGPDDEYAIIADVTAVRKLKFNVSAFPKGEEDAELDLNTSDAFTAEGKCLALLNVGHEQGK